MYLGIMKDLNEHLLHYAHPHNGQGFFIDFVDWVIKQWTTRPYYRVERFPTRYELANHPIRTDFLLHEMQPIYRDLIHSYTGRHHFSPVAVNGTNCETLEKEFYDYFHEAMRLEGILFLEDVYPEVEAEDFWDKIFLEEFKDEAEIKMMDKLCLNFGFYALAAEPYTCVPPDVESSHPGPFAEWCLEDFQNARHARPISDKRERPVRSRPKLYPNIAPVVQLSLADR